VVNLTCGSEGGEPPIIGDHEGLGANLRRPVVWKQSPHLSEAKVIRGQSPSS